jgi:hypothetical protein
LRGEDSASGKVVIIGEDVGIWFDRVGDDRGIILAAGRK